MIIGIDVDDVVADLVTEWLRLYNTKHEDTVRLDQITTWEIFNHVKCGTKIYDFLKVPNLYANVAPIKWALWGIASLRNAGHRVIFITSCIYGGNVDGKWRWLVENKFLEPGLHAMDFMAVSDKVLINIDLMIDDKPTTIESFKDRGLLFSRPWNNGVATWASIVDQYGSHALYEDYAG